MNSKVIKIVTRELKLSSNLLVISSDIKVSGIYSFVAIGISLRRIVKTELLYNMSDLSDKLISWFKSIF